MQRLLASLLLFCATAFAQYTDLSAIHDLGGPQEFANRRAALCKTVGDKGTIVLFARITLPESNHYREDNDFFYYTGLREPGAIMVLDSATCKPTIFQPQYSARMIQVLGPTILSRSNEERAQLGYSTVLPVTEVGPDEYDVELRVPAEIAVGEGAGAALPAGGERIGATAHARDGEIPVGSRLITASARYAQPTPDRKGHDRLPFVSPGRR